MLNNSALVKLDPETSGDFFGAYPAEEPRPTTEVIAFTHPTEQLSETTFEDVGMHAVQKQASAFRRQKASQTDEVLFEKIANDRNQAAYSEFYDRFSPRIYALLLHMLRAEEDAQDLLQEVFVQVWQKAPLYLESRGNVAAWVISLARNRAVDELRSRRYRDRAQEAELLYDEDRPEIDTVMVETKTPDMGLHAADTQREVQRALHELTRDQRRIVDMAYFGGLTHVEIAERLEIPIGTVKTKIRQAVIKMGKVLRHKF